MSISKFSLKSVTKNSEIYKIFDAKVNFHNYTSKTIGFTMFCVGVTLVANAATVKLGSDAGALVFVPDALTIKTGEVVEFVNNVGFPHNVVFDEDNVPEGIDVELLSHEDYLNAPGEKVTTKFEKAGTYGYYCEPHRGAGMMGKIVVQ